jgi:hypothetical protein
MNCCQVPQWGLNGEGCPFPEPSFSHTLIKTKAHLFLTVLAKGSPLHIPPMGPLWREMLHLQSQWFIHCLSESPVKELSHEMRGRHMVIVHWAPHGWKACIQRGAAWFPMGIGYDTAVTTAVTCSLQHDTLNFGFCSPEPRWPACVVVTLIRVSPLHLLLPPTWPRVSIHVTVWLVTGGRILFQIVSTFPCWWFQSQQQGDSVCLPQLHMFVAQLKTITQCLDVTTPAGRYVCADCFVPSAEGVSDLKSVYGLNQWLLRRRLAVHNFKQ